MGVELVVNANSLIKKIIEDMTKFEDGDIDKERFRVDNISGYPIDVSKYWDVIKNIKVLLMQSIDLLNNNEFPETVLEQIIRTIKDIPNSIQWMVYTEKPTKQMIENQINEHFGEILSSSFQLKELINSYIFISAKNNNRIESIVNDLIGKSRRADEMLAKITSAEQEVKSKTTFQVYESADKRYKDMAFLYQGVFFIFCVLFFTALCVFTFGDFFDLSTHEGMFKFIYFKITLLVILGVLITYFLKLAAFYRKKSEEAYQTQVELEAFPDFVADMDSNDILEIRKELVKCYFGKMNKNESLDKLSDDLDSKIKILSELMLASSSTLKENKK